MKKYLFIFFAILCLSCQKYDDTEVKGLISSLEYRLQAAETALKASASKAYVVSVKNNGDSYLITFSNGTSATYSSGADGKTGSDGKDGIEGPAGKDGNDGPDGKDGKVLVNYVDDYDNYMIFFFEDGSRIMVPKVNYISVSLTKQHSGDDTCIEYAYKVTSFISPVTIEVLCSEWLKAVVSGSSDMEGTLIVSSITGQTPSGYVWFIASNEVNVSTNKLEI